MITCYMVKGPPLNVNSPDVVEIKTPEFVVLVINGSYSPPEHSKRVPLSFFYKIAESRGEGVSGTKEDALDKVNGWVDAINPTFEAHKPLRPADVMVPGSSLLEVQSTRERKKRFSG